jgi:threonine dehydratase
VSTVRAAGREPTLVGLDDVRAAADRIAGRVVRTPLLPATWAPGLWLKPECLQPTGAFKLRGALNAVARLSPGRRAAGVVTHSSGNHAQALARAAREAGTTAVVVMPDNSPSVKVEATRREGAEVVLVDVTERLATAERLAAERGLTLVPPFDHADVIAGQGTVGLEVVEDRPDVITVLVPVGGGGLASGVAAAVRALAPRARVVGVEPELAGEVAEGLRLGHRVRWPAERTGRTVADGVRTGPSELTWAHLEALLDDVVTVDEQAILDAMRLVVLRSRLVCEPSGAVATAAVTSGLVDPGAGPVVAVVSGGNVDPELLARVVAG